MLNFLSVLNLVVTLSLMVGGLLAYQHGFTRTANEVQERVIHLLQSEIGALQDRISALEKENTRLNHIITTIRSSLKRRGLYITIDGELVSIHERGGRMTQATRIHGEAAARDAARDDEEEEEG
ncbi:MAG TPA: hypothetical protein VGT44_00195 [Ktedonobacteraceae bacterium]|nr:hypothetical protein [Ktedonobacteraceae bacterium]